MEHEEELKLVKLEVENDLLKARIKELEADRDRLTARLDSTQDALVAAASPTAYADQQAELYEAAKTPQQREEEVLREKSAKKNGELLGRMEDPLFQDADDMIETLMRGIGGPQDRALHPNDES